ncbi:Uncharacterised protein [uncultured Eubacterium sp.]|nr:Uncharacterised protein [uncultured Eubacterium sp.]
MGGVLCVSIAFNHQKTMVKYSRKLCDSFTKSHNYGKLLYYVKVIEI